MTDTVTMAVERVMPEDEALTLWRDTPVPDRDPTPFTATRKPLILTLDGEPIILQLPLPDDLTAFLRRALLDFPLISKVMRGAGIRNRAQVFGYVAKNPMLSRASCRASAAAAAAPEAHAALCDMARALAHLLRLHLPDQHEANRAAAAEVLPDWLLPGGLWTSGVVNFTSSLPYHRDRNNFDVWSAMPVIRRATRGGHLHFPEIDVTVPCRDGDVLMFNGQRFMHGVTPIRKTADDGYRYSAVYYPVRKMRSCLAAEVELAEARRRRTALEDGLIERQRAAGLIQDEIAAELADIDVHEPTS